MANHGRKGTRQQCIPFKREVSHHHHEESLQESERQMRKPEAGKLDNFLFRCFQRRETREIETGLSGGFQSSIPHDLKGNGRYLDRDKAPEGKQVTVP